MPPHTLEPARILVLHAPAGGGHRAAAAAVVEAAEGRGLEAELVDALELTPAWFARAYVGAHLSTTERTPGLYGQAYAALNRRDALADLRAAFDRGMGARLRRFVTAARPTAIVATHFFPLAVLGRARRRGELDAPLVGVVTDYTAHAYWAEPGVDRFCTAAGRAARDLVRHGVSADRIVATGIPIRAAFGRVPPLVEKRDRESKRVLITSGGFGVGPMVDVIRSFAGIPWVELTVVCGANPHRVEQAWHAAAQAGVSAHVIGFENDMPGRLAAADVVVGKPGGLTVSEVAAAGRPMVIVGACPGQEMMNQAWMIENGAAVSSLPDQAGETVAALFAEKGRLMTMARAALRIAMPDAAGRVVDVAQVLAGRYPGVRAA